jgi:hypothetical protein
LILISVTVVSLRRRNRNSHRMKSLVSNESGYEVLGKPGAAEGST